MSKGAIIALGVVGVIVLVVIGVIGWFSGLMNEGRSQQNGLNAQYVQCQNVLSEFYSTVYDQFEVLSQAPDAVTEILAGALAGRYGEGGANFDGQGFVNAISEAYPDTSELQINFRTLQDVVAAGRTNFSNCQQNLLARLQSFDDFRNAQFPNSLIAGAIFPDDNLAARRADITLYGRSAYEQMYSIVRDQDAITSYATGEAERIDLGGNNDGE